MDKLGSYKINFEEQLRTFGFNNSERNFIFQKSYSVNLKKREEFIIDYSKSSLIFIQKGLVTLNRTLPDESEVGTLLLCDPIVFPISCESERVYGGTERLVCQADSEFLILSGACLDKVVNRNHEAKYKILRCCYIRERFISDEAFLRAKLNKYQWLVLFLAQLLASKKSIEMTSENLACISATTRQFCANSISRLEENGAIQRRYGTIQLLDMKKLTSELPENLIKNIDIIRNNMSDYYVESKRRILLD